MIGGLEKQCLYYVFSLAFSVHQCYSLERCLAHTGRVGFKVGRDSASRPSDIDENAGEGRVDGCVSVWLLCIR